MTVPTRLARRARALGLGLVVALPGAAFPTPLGAQVVQRSAESEGWTTLRVAKWALLGASVALGGYALSNSRRASHAYGRLHGLCDADAARCALAEGRYADAQAEALYRTTVRRDRRARVGILGGHGALLGSAALFVADLRRPRAPVDIPYPVPPRPAPPRERAP